MISALNLKLLATAIALPLKFVNVDIVRSDIKTIKYFKYSKF